jgi:hypothetical protein
MLCHNHFHPFGNRYEEPGYMILYDIIRHHIPQSSPEGESWEGPFFKRFFYQDFWNRNGVSYFIQEKDFV